MLAVSSQFAGAVATVEFLMYFDYFARKTFGEDYLKTNQKEIDASLQHVVYTINQPSVSRGYQSIFWNISIYDKPYFEAMFGDFCFPDGQRPNYESLSKFQKYFMKWFNKERTSALLTYPVVTAACLTENGTLKDKDFEDFITEEYAEGNGFFTFMSDNPHALSSCCRLKNDVHDQMNQFSYTLGAGGVSTGSLNVITINVNRAIQRGLDIREMVQKIHKYHIATRKLMEQYLEAGLMPVYDAGYISMDKQFLTVGLNGIVEAAEYLGMDITLNDKYMDFVENLLKTISDENKIRAKETGYKFNTEFVPAENLGVKNARWDKKDGLKVNRDCYNSYLYKVEDEDVSVLDKFQMHGKRFIQYLDGGSAYHCNLAEYPTQEGFRKLLHVAAQEGCEYFCFNIRVTCCNDCGKINKHTLTECLNCHSKNIDYATRVIGYLRKVSCFSKERREEHARRKYAVCPDLCENKNQETEKQAC
jgi:ribonucleoside-triphosphate reductase